MQTLPSSKPEHIAFERLRGSHILHVPAQVNGEHAARFIVDTGVGINVISRSLCEAIECKIEGSFTGRRMSGQELTVPLTTIASLTLGSMERRHIVAGVMDMEALGEAFHGIDGFLSLGFFSERALTYDYGRNEIIVETETTLAARAKSSAVVSLGRKVQGPSHEAFIELTLPGGRRVQALIDTGSDSLILPESDMDSLGVDPNAEETKVLQGTDETGGHYRRTLATLQGSVALTQAPDIRQANPRTLFQPIIHEGLVGHGFLSQFVVTIDWSGSRALFSQPDTDPRPAP